MNIAIKANLKLEILLSTMNRNSLSFLEALFPDGNYRDYNILIINQTSENHLIESELPNIRVINSFEKGLSKSRNLAIKNAIGDICLIADDDVIYCNNFEKIIVDSFKKQTQADVITFKMKDFHGRDFKKYSRSNWHNLESLKQVNSVVIAFKLESVVKKKIVFNPLFGLGSIFETAEEYIFIRDCLKTKLKLWFESQYILSHDINSSGKDVGSDKLVYANAALYYKYSSFLGYLRLCKLIWVLKKDNYIDISQIVAKYKIGLRGVLAYKKIIKQKRNQNS
jgi:hypothetical protein